MPPRHSGQRRPRDFSDDGRPATKPPPMQQMQQRQQQRQQQLGPKHADGTPATKARDGAAAAVTPRGKPASAAALPQQQARSIVHVDDAAIAAIKAQMVPLQHRSDFVDVRACVLGVRECHVVAALLGLPAAHCLARRIAPARQAPATTPTSGSGPEGAVPSALPSATGAESVVEPIAPFFHRVTALHLQLGASMDGGLGAVMLAARLQHANYVRHLDLSRNMLREADGPAVGALVEACNSLAILDISHNRDLRSVGCVHVCRAAATLGGLRALLMQRCSIDDNGARDIAGLMTIGALPNRVRAIAFHKSRAAAARGVGDDGDDSAAVAGAAADLPSVLLTMDVSCNRIGHQGLHALRRALPPWVGISAEKQSPPVLAASA